MSCLCLELIGAAATGKKMVEQLKVPETVAFQDRENQDHSYAYWIAQTMDTGNGSCVVKQYTERETIIVICFTPGNYVLAIRW